MALTAVRIAVIGLLFGVEAGAQALPAGTGPTTRWLFDFETGSDEALGFKLPHLKFGTSFERQIGKLEIQGEVGYSPDRKYITNNGNSLRLESKTLVWINERVAITGSVERSKLWTSQFEKSALYPTFGVAFRNYWGNLPGRFYVDYVLPRGCEWGASCPIQSSRLQGPQIYWETLMYSHFRMGVEMGFYHILEQSNNLRPDIPRIGSIAGDVHLVMRFQFPGGSLDRRY